MSFTCSSLVRAEWQQRRGQFAIALLWMVCVGCYAVVGTRATGLPAPLGCLFSGTMLFGLTVPIFVAMRTALGEVTDGTRAFSVSLPIGLQLRAFIRIGGGLFVLWVPVIIAALIVTAAFALGWIEQAALRPAGSHTGWDLPERTRMTLEAALLWTWTLAAINLASITTLYLLLVIIGNWLSSETRLGFVGAVMGIAWLMLYGAAVLAPMTSSLQIPWIVQAILPQTMVVGFGYGTERASYNDVVFSQDVGRALLVSLLWFAVLMLIGARLAGQQVRLPARPRSYWKAWLTEGRLMRLVRVPALRMPTRATSLVWLSVRQALPMLLPALFVAGAIALVEMLQDQAANSSLGLQRWIDHLAGTMWFVAMLWAAVVGAGMFAPELRARADEFWRILPIPAGQLFAVKFFTGLFVVLAVLDGTVFALGYFSPQFGDYYAMNWGYVACMMPMHALVYSLAVAWTCMLRGAVMGGLATVGSFMLLNIVSNWFPRHLRWDLISTYNWIALEEGGRYLSPGYLIPLAIALAMFAAAMGVGYWMLTRYRPLWGAEISN